MAPSDLERAIATALDRGLVRREALLALTETHSGRRGVRRLRRLLGQSSEPAFTRSEAESRLLALVRKVELPLPGTNARIGRYEVDFYWRSERLVVEVDGFAFHSSRRQFERDRRRDADLAAHGLRVMRVTWQQIVNEPARVLVRLAQALARAVQP